MSCIVYQVDKKTGAKYAYESISYWDKDRQQPRSKRKYIGRVDPETGEIIRKKEKQLHSEDTSDESGSRIADLERMLEEKDREISSLNIRIKDTEKKYAELLKTITKAADILGAASKAI